MQCKKKKKKTSREWEGVWEMSCVSGSAVTWREALPCISENSAYFVVLEQCQDAWVRVCSVSSDGIAPFPCL